MTTKDLGPLTPEEAALKERTLATLVNGTRLPEELRLRVRWLTNPDEFAPCSPRDLRTAAITLQALEEFAAGGAR